MKKEAIIFVPGYDSKECGDRLKQVVDDLQTYNSIGKVTVSEDTELYGHTGLSLLVHYDDGTTRTIDIYEAFWADLRQKFNIFKPHQKVLYGFSTLWYWASPKTWSLASGDFSKGLVMLLSMLMLIFWYVLILATFILLVKSADINTGWTWLDETLQKLVDHMPDLKFLLSLSILTSFLPINQVAGISYNTMLYLKNEAVHNAIRRRVHDITFDAIHQTDAYDKITILAHSLGGAIAAHYVSGMKPDIAKYKVRFITLGAAISFLSLRSDWMRTIVKQCFTQTHLHEWLDYYATEDWLCSSMRLEHKEREQQGEVTSVGSHFISRRLKFTSTMLEQILQSSTIHKLYTRNSEVVNRILQ